MSEAPPTRRRWFQFSLARMLVSVSLVAIATVGFRTLFIEDSRMMSFTGTLFLLFGSSIASTVAVGILIRKEEAAVILGILVAFIVVGVYILALVRQYF